MASSEPQEPSTPSSEPPLPSSDHLINRKEAKKQEKHRHGQDTALTSAASKLVVDEPLAGNYGDYKMEDLQSKDPPRDPNRWTPIKNMEKSLEGKPILIRGRVSAIRRSRKKMVFSVVRKKLVSVQCVVHAQKNLVSVQMVQHAGALTNESIIGVEGLVLLPSEPIKGATKQVS